jgi:hypothetical protein
MITVKCMSDIEDEHKQFRWYDPRRCLYTILLPRGKHPNLDYDETPYAHIDTKLLLSSPALYCSATLPIYLEELLLEPIVLQFRDEVRPHHTVGYVFDDQWAEVSKMLAIYPFGVVYDMRKSGQLVTAPIGHVPISGDAMSVSTVIPSWIEDGEAAIERISTYWPKATIASLRGWTSITWPLDGRIQA